MKSRKLDSTIIAFPMNPTEYRDAMERKKTEQEILKRRTFAALTAPQFDAQQRIQIWESLHGLHLPKAADHQLLDQIAKKTDLTVKQVRDEQIRRREALAGVSKLEPVSPVSENP